MASRTADAAMQPSLSAASSTGASHSAHAQRLMRRLEACDKQLSLLLLQTADSLESLLSKSRQGAGTSQQADLGEFEDVAQDWLASVYDIQLMLRKAVRFLVRSSRPPIMTAAHSFIPGGGVSAAAAGTALRAPWSAVSLGRELNQEGKEESLGREAGGGGGGGVEEGRAAGPKAAEVSLSALRLEHQAWRELICALEEMKGSGTRVGPRPPRPERDLVRRLGLPALAPAAT